MTTKGTQNGIKSQSESKIVQKQPENKINQKSKLQYPFVSELYRTIKKTIDNQLKLKKIIQCAQKIDFMSHVPHEHKINIKHFLFIHIFILFNSTAYGVWMFSHKQYRKFKYISIYMIALTYLGLSFGIFWQDQAFLNKISTKQDVYRSEIKYVLRKECLQKIQHLQRLQHKKQLFRKLNIEFQKFHQVNKNSKLVSLLP